MSDMVCEVFKVTKVEPILQAHSLDLIEAFGNPCVVRRGDFKPGDLAVYIPENALVPLTDARFSFLKEPRIRPIKLLKGTVYSEGLVIRADAGWKCGEDVKDRLGITKWEPPEPGWGGSSTGKKLGMGTENEKDPGHMPVYDVEQYKKYREQLQFGEEVVVTEKIHGMNFRASFVRRPMRKWFGLVHLIGSLLCRWACSRSWGLRMLGRFYVGSHERIKRRNSRNLFWQIAQKYDLETKLAQCPGYVFYGEVFGSGIQKGFPYGAIDGERFLRFFDIYDATARSFLSYDHFAAIIDRLELDRMPVLYRGPYSSDTIEPLCEGIAHAYYRQGHRLIPVHAEKAMDGSLVLAFPSDVADFVRGSCNPEGLVKPDHIREGIVVKPVLERRDSRIGRVILKLVSHNYKIRNLNGTDFH